MDNTTNQSGSSITVLTEADYQELITTVRRTLDSALGPNAVEQDRQEMLNAFQEDFARMRQMLLKSLTAQDAAALGKATHYVRGTLNTLNASNLVKVVDSITEPAQQGCWEDVNARCTYVTTTLDALHLFLQDWARKG